MHLWRWRSPVCSRSQAHPIIGNDFFTFSTDHKVIGIQYIVTAFVFFLFAGLLAMIMRGELITPEADLVDRTVYNGLFTMHGTLMLFMWTFPMLNGLANYLVPLMIGARDMAFPRLNAAAFWLVPVFGTILTASFFIPGGPSQSGWWAYPPVSLQNPTGNLINGQLLWLVAVALSGVSSIMGAVNIVTTIFRMRAPGMGWFKMPAFCWTVLAAQLIQLFGLPALTAGAVMLLFDLTVGTSFFNPALGGDPVLYQHFFLVLLAPGSVCDYFADFWGVLRDFPGVCPQAVVWLSGGGGVIADYYGAERHRLGTPYVCQRHPRLDADAVYVFVHDDFNPYGHQGVCLGGDHLGGQNSAQYPHAVCPGRTGDVGICGHYGHHAGLRALRYSRQQYVLCGGPFSLRDLWRSGDGVLCRHLPLVPQDDGAHVLRRVGQAALCADLCRRESQLFPDAPGGPDGHAPAGGVLRPGVCLLERAGEFGGVFVGRLDAAVPAQYAEFLDAGTRSGRQPLASDRPGMVGVFTAAPRKL